MDGSSFFWLSDDFPDPPPAPLHPFYHRPLTYCVTKNRARTVKGEILSPGGRFTVRLSTGFRSQRPPFRFWGQRFWQSTEASFRMQALSAV